MSATRFLLSGLFLLALAGSLRADPPLPLDLIPEDTCIGLSARNLAELRTKSDRLFKDREPGLRPVAAPRHGLQATGAGLDDRREEAVGHRVSVRHPGRLRRRR